MRNKYKSWPHPGNPILISAHFKPPFQCHPSFIAIVGFYFAIDPLSGLCRGTDLEQMSGVAQSVCATLLCGLFSLLKEELPTSQRSIKSPTTARTGGESRGKSDDSGAEDDAVLIKGIVQVSVLAFTSCWRIQYIRIWNYWLKNE